VFEQRVTLSVPAHIHELVQRSSPRVSFRDSCRPLRTIIVRSARLYLGASQLPTAMTSRRRPEPSSDFALGASIHDIVNLRLDLPAQIRIGTSGECWTPYAPETACRRQGSALDDAGSTSQDTE
jgi:hypothetical protein